MGFPLAVGLLLFSQVEFPDGLPGRLVTPLDAKVTDSRVAALIELPKPDRMGYAGVPLMTWSESYADLPVYHSSSSGKVLVALPFASDEKSRVGSLTWDRKAYAIRLPISRAFGPAKREPKVHSFDGGDLRIEFPLLRTSLSFPPTRARVMSAVGRPYMIGFKGSGPNARDSRARWLLEDASDTATAPYGVAMILPLKAERIKLRVVKNSALMELYLPNGDRLYNRYHQLSGKSGFVAIKLSNIYFSNFRVMNRPRGVTESYSRISNGQTVDAVGYRPMKKKPLEIRTGITLPKMGTGPELFLAGPRPRISFD